MNREQHNYRIEFALECMMLEGEEKDARIKSLVAQFKLNQGFIDRAHSVVIVEETDDCDNPAFRIFKLVDGQRWGDSVLVQEEDFDDMVWLDHSLDRVTELRDFLRSHAIRRAIEISREEYDDWADVWFAMPKRHEEGFQFIEQAYFAKNREQFSFDRYLVDTEAA